MVSPPFANDKMRLERFDSIQLLIVYTYLRPKVCTDCEDIFPVCQCVLLCDDIFNLRPYFFLFFPSSRFGLVFWQLFGFCKSKKYTSTVHDRKNTTTTTTTHTTYSHIITNLSIYQKVSINQYTGARCVSMNQEILSASEDEVNVVVVISFTSLVVVVVVVAKEKHVPS